MAVCVTGVGLGTHAHLVVSLASLRAHMVRWVARVSVQQGCSADHSEWHAGACPQARPQALHTS